MERRDQHRSRVRVPSSSLGGGTRLHVDEADVILSATEVQSLFGASLSALPDIDGDGLDELVVGATDISGAYIFKGSQLRAGGSYSHERAFTKIELPFDPENPNPHIGFSTTSLGDLDGDGRGELAVGAPGWAPSERGSVALFRGSDLADGGVMAVTSADVMVLGDVPTADVGRSITSPGDLDGDGFDDLLVGSYRLAAGEITSEDDQVAFFSGRGLLAESVDVWLSSADSIIRGAPQVGGAFGKSLAGLGDVDGDGRDDFAIAAPRPAPPRPAPPEDQQHG
ncbi:MAG: hypothetical protein GY898_10350 [Proteobacteria bacterium]|nr:hypothetical protein [Pseudomonadota bacterium]